MSRLDEIISRDIMHCEHVFDDIVGRDASVDRAWLIKRVRQLERLVKAQDELLRCYTLALPRFWDALDEAKDARDALDGGEA